MDDGELDHGALDVEGDLGMGSARQASAVSLSMPTSAAHSGVAVCREPAVGIGLEHHLFGIATRGHHVLPRRESARNRVPIEVLCRSL